MREFFVDISSAGCNLPRKCACC